MSEMIWRSVRAADAAGDLYLASLPTRLDQRPAGWRRELATVRMRAALSAALDESEAEAVARRWKPWAFDEANAYYPYRGAIRAAAINDAREVIAALKSASLPPAETEERST